MKKIALFLFVLAFPVFLLLQSFDSTVYDLDKFDTNFNEENIMDTTGKSHQELMAISEDLLDYLRGEDLDLSLHFGKNEVLHMEDVRHLFYYGYKIRNLAFIVSLCTMFYFIFKKNIGYFYWGVSRAFFIWWGILLGLLVFIALDFNKYFTYFHLILFSNDLWLMDPSKDLMIQMLPESFFMNMFKNIMIMFLTLFVGIHILFLNLDKKTKRRTKC